ncbi:MAG: hypothetical protein HY255_07055, partial [Betaproteobacteria bacterium]|nr:hypothetical protein [Betaproteobacteria bacterium]
MHFCQSVFRKLAVALLVLLLGGAMAPVLAQQLSFPADIHYVPWCPNCATNLGAGKWGSATVAAQRLAVGRDLSCGSPANNASSVTFDHVQQQFLGPQFYDSFFDGYWLFTPCRPGGLSGLYNSSILFTGLGGALRVYTCPAGMSLTT